MATKQTRPTIDKLIFAAILAMSGYDTHSKSEIASKLDKIEIAMVNIGQSLSVLVTQITAHEKRLDKLEESLAKKRP